MTTTWILGAPDPEMTAIEALIAACGQTVLHATVAGRRVHPSNAYRVDGLDGPTRRLGAQGEVVVLVECGFVGCNLAADLNDCKVVRCDHHHEGDPGFGRSPFEFLTASSVGQVVALLAGLHGREPGDVWESEEETPLLPWEATGEDLPLPDGIAAMVAWSGDDERWYVAALDGWTAWVPRAIVLTAAADHCLAAAYAGRCPGVDPAELAEYRLQQRAEWLAAGPGQGRDAPRAAAAQAAAEEERQIDVDGVHGWERAIRCAYTATESTLATAPRIRLCTSCGGTGQEQYGGHGPLVACPECDDDTGWAPQVIDLRSTGTLPELPEVLAHTGQCALYRMIPPAEARDGRVKIGIIGGGLGTVPGTTPIEAFLGGWAAAQSLVGLYGDPARGFAGGYEG